MHKAARQHRAAHEEELIGEALVAAIVERQLLDLDRCARLPLLANDDEAAARLAG